MKPERSERKASKCDQTREETRYLQETRHIQERNKTRYLHEKETRHERGDKTHTIQERQDKTRETKTRQERRASKCEKARHPLFQPVMAGPRVSQPKHLVQKNVKNLIFC